MKKELPFLKALKNKEWLETEYRIKSVAAIAREIGCSESCVKRYLNISSIELRSPLENRRLNYGVDGLSLRNMAVIEGSLLGDASISLCKGRKLPRFSKANKHYAHIAYVARMLFGENADKRINLRTNRLRGKEYPIWHIRSLGHEDLVPLYDLWYPENNNRKKAVPRSLLLSPETVLHWFLDDGWSYYRRRYGQKVIGQCCVEFCTEGFSEEDNYFLCGLMGNIGITATVARSGHGSKCRIFIPQRHTKNFFDIIGPCPPELESVLGYKWKIAIPWQSEFPQLRDRDWLYNSYIENKKTAFQISLELGCSLPYVTRYIRKFKL